SRRTRDRNAWHRASSPSEASSTASACSTRPALRPSVQASGSALDRERAPSRRQPARPAWASRPAVGAEAEAASRDPREEPPPSLALPRARERSRRVPAQALEQPAPAWLRARQAQEPQLVRTLAPPPVASTRLSSSRMRAHRQRRPRREPRQQD